MRTPPLTLLLAFCACWLIVSEPPASPDEVMVAQQIRPVTTGVGAAGPVKMFLRLQGVQGGSTDAAHTGWVDVLDWGFGAQLPLAGAGPGRMARGTPQVRQLIITKRVDVSTPKLFDMCVSNTNIPEGQFEMTTAGGTLGMTLEDVRVVSTGREIGADADVTTERVTLNAAAYTIRFRTPSGTVEAMWRGDGT